ncbi:ABC transporter ATP-binding protein [Mesorhizobium sp. 2RAF21]|uniref:ABC transporter ATP-binding protein n=1 Tax=Mesorhizobium sp. 2RAF21 TaxID=3232995 RepID=UPI003F984545
MLKIEAVTKSFGGVRALANVDLSCESGEILGLIGPNGAGKSSLVNAISGVIKLDEGSVKLGGQNIAGHGAEFCARAGVARTFQNIRLFKELTVRQNIEVALITCAKVRPHIASKINIDTLLEEYNLLHFSDVPAGTLAYGNQRRLEIARALALGPKLLLLDEPAAGMNEAESEVLTVAIENIRRNVGCATIVIDHDLQFINKLCDRLCVMDQGRVIKSGDRTEVWADARVIEVYTGRPIEN